MFKLSKTTLPLSLIVVFAFLYRFFLLVRAGYPPGADIGLHNSIIHSITLSGNTDFLWNYYHMGGGVSLTFPGYHIFVSYIILVTGLSDIMAHTLVSCLFSSLIVFVAYLITRKIWTPTAAFIVAFLVAFSRWDLEMLAWGGYPNIVALFLLPLTFYLFMQKTRFSFSSFLVLASLLSASILLTHSLSAAIFVGVIFMTAVFVAVFSRRLKIGRAHV
jgi:hypothetical protein